jgi:hypothetical protein
MIWKELGALRMAVLVVGRKPLANFEPAFTADRAKVSQAYGMIDKLQIEIMLANLLNKYFYS